MAEITDIVTWTEQQIATLRYEELRDALDTVVAALEDADIPLEELMKLWEIGEKLAAECEAQLTRARERIEAPTTEG